MPNCSLTEEIPVLIQPDRLSPRQSIPFLTSLREIHAPDAIYNPDAKRVALLGIDADNLT
jgi:hypothetical protein